MIPAKRVFMILVGVNLLMVGAIAGSFTMANKIAAQKSAQIADTKADIQTNDQAISDFKALQKSIDANKEISDIAAEVLPQDKEQSAALAELNQFSKSAGVPIRQVSFLPGKDGLTSPSNLKGVSVLSVTVHCEASQYSQLLNFLKKIESNRRRMQVTSVGLAPSDKTAGLLDRIDLSIDIYLKP